MKYYSRTYHSLGEILKIIGSRLSGLHINKIESAYDFADKALENVNHFEVPIFFHTTRVCKSLVDEFEIFNPEMIISSLLSDIHKSKEELSYNIIDLNFGAYVTFIVELMSKQDENGIIDIEQLNSNFENASVNIDDFLTIWLIKHLDNFRCIDFVISPKMTSYIFSFNEILNSVDKITESNQVIKIADKIKKERNKLLC
jgi:hypothetical protein